MSIILAVCLVALYSLFMMYLADDDENMWPDDLFEDEDLKD